VAESPTRVEAFSDGVFAIAITLLILEIKVPHAGEHGLWTGLAALWPSYVAFLLSFFVILIMWVNHHELLRMVHAVDYRFLFANGFVLLTVTFVPFPTAVLAEHLATAEAGQAVAFYCATFVANSLAWNLLWASMVRGGLLRPEIDAATIAGIRKAYLQTPFVYTASTIVAFFVPALGLLINASLWVLYIRLSYRNEARRPVAVGLIALVCAGTLSACKSQRSEDFAAMQSRGQQVMGVDQYSSAHVFEDLTDGGRVVLERDDPADTAAIATIRAHMRDIATAFRAGDFTKPFQVHDQDVPGTDVMRARRNSIGYEVIDRPRGGEVRIRTADPEAIRAIHTFLGFQRTEHHSAGH
jgi:uncharacterized membrane protein